MQATYYQYYFTKSNRSTKYKIDLFPLLAKYCAWGNSGFKSEFERGGEKLFLVHDGGPGFLFLQTLDREIIKKINAKTLGLDDLRKHLAGDSAGFASYVSLHPDYFGVACKILSPRGLVFVEYVNELFVRLGLDWVFHVVALTHRTERKEIPKLKRVGRVSVKLERENTLHQDLVNFMAGKTGRQYDDVGEIEISIRPRSRRGDLKEILAGVSGRIGDAGVADFEARAVTAVSDKVIDVYLVGAGAVRHPVMGDSDKRIWDSFDRQMKSSELLQRKLHDIRNDKGYKVEAFDIGNMFGPSA